LTTHAGGGGSLQTLQGGPADGGSMSGMASFLSESGTPDWVSEFRLVPKLMTRHVFDSLSLLHHALAPFHTQVLGMIERFQGVLTIR
jgi:hypothetical protein